MPLIFVKKMNMKNLSTNYTKKISVIRAISGQKTC